MSVVFPKAVFWDWDGTIADSYAFLNDAHNHTLIMLGFEPFKGDAYREYFGKPREILYPAIYKDKCEEAKEVFQAYVFENADRVRIIDGCAEVLDFLHGRGVVMGVVSNKKAAFIQEEMKHTGLGHYFSCIVGAGDAKADKPSAAPLHYAVSIAGLEPDYKNIWFVGDTENDMKCAQEAGAHAVLLKDSAQGTALEAQYNPFFSFENYSQFKEFLVAI